VLLTLQFELNDSRLPGQRLSYKYLTFLNRGKIWPRPQILYHRTKIYRRLSYKRSSKASNRETGVPAPHPLHAKGQNLLAHFIITTKTFCFFNPLRPNGCAACAVESMIKSRFRVILNGGQHCRSKLSFLTNVNAERQTHCKTEKVLCEAVQQSKA